MSGSLKVVIILLSLVLVLTACSSQTVSEESTTAENASYAVETEGLAFGELFAYEGPYVEDASDQQVGNVAAIRVVNNTDTAVRYALITASTTAGELHFTATTLLPGRPVILLESGKAPYTGGELTGIMISDKVLFNDPPQLYQSVFEITPEDGYITLRNISHEDVNGEIYVYFKRVDNSGLLGGITYRVGFSDLAAGASLTRAASNMRVSDCAILFIECQNPPEAQ